MRRFFACTHRVCDWGETELLAGSLAGVRLLVVILVRYLAMDCTISFYASLIFRPFLVEGVL